MFTTQLNDSLLWIECKNHPYKLKRKYVTDEMVQLNFYMLDRSNGCRAI